jgi:DNA mismatch endonuclease (patch repair protein)
MADLLTPEQRSKLMASVRQRDTKPEMFVRRALHARGLRFRLNDKRLPGSPDLVFPRFRTVVFVHGCFWHLHGCRLSALPGSRQEYWRPKLEANAARDSRAIAALVDTGWRVLVIWECGLKGPGRLGDVVLADRAEQFIRFGRQRVQHLPSVATETLRCPR